MLRGELNRDVTQRQIGGEGGRRALVELRLRKPAYPDFLALRDDAQTLRGWYRNRVTRVVLVFMLTNLGTVAGEWMAGARIFGKLLG